MTISMVDVDVGPAEKARVAEIMDSGMLADGPEVRAFEDEFAQHCEVEHAVATSNGTTALHAALVACGIGPGDRVITTPFTFIASANSIRLAGAEPVFADIDPETFNIDPDAVESLLREDPSGYDAILAVHLYGLPADMVRLSELATDHDLTLIEDAAQAHGATVAGEPVGSIGDAGCFSFYPTKNMTTGEGGMVTSNDETIADRAASFANHGRVAGARAYDHGSLGHNFRMTSIAAAIGREQLEKLPGYVEARQANARRLTERLDGIVVTPVVPEGMTHAFHQYTIRSQDRDGLQKSLENHDIGAGVYYPRPVTDERVYQDVEFDVPRARQAAAEVLSLPVHPGISDEDIDHVTEVIRSYGS